jgi:hypothetical protein
VRTPKDTDRYQHHSCWYIVIQRFRFIRWRHDGVPKYFFVTATRFKSLKMSRLCFFLVENNKWALLDRWTEPSPDSTGHAFTDRNNIPWETMYPYIIITPEPWTGGPSRLVTSQCITPETMYPYIICPWGSTIYIINYSTNFITHSVYKLIPLSLEIGSLAVVHDALGIINLRIV